MTWPRGEGDGTLGGDRTQERHREGQGLRGTYVGDSIQEDPWRGQGLGGTHGGHRTWEQHRKGMKSKRDTWRG